MSVHDKLAAAISQISQLSFQPTEIWVEKRDFLAMKLQGLNMNGIHAYNDMSYYVMKSYNMVKRLKQRT